MYIATRAGKIQASETLACTVVKILFPDVEIKRAQDKKIIKNAYIVIGTGEEYNPDTGRFDYNQDDFKMEYIKNVPVSSAGLIWNHYGEFLISKIARNKLNKSQKKEIHHRVYKRLFLEIDAHDNRMHTGKICHTHLTNLIAIFNCKQEFSKYQELQFSRAMVLCNEILLQTIKSCIAFVLSKKGEYKSFKKQFKNNKFDNKAVILESHIKNIDYCVKRYESEFFESIKTCVFVVNSEFNKFRINCVFDETVRKPLISRGKYSCELQPNIEEIHRNKFSMLVNSYSAVVKILNLNLSD